MELPAGGAGTHPQPVKPLAHLQTDLRYPRPRLRITVRSRVFFRPFDFPNPDHRDIPFPLPSPDDIITGIGQEMQQLTRCVPGHLFRLEILQTPEAKAIVLIQYLETPAFGFAPAQHILPRVDLETIYIDELVGRKFRIVV